jgi:hypothetical protein
MLQIQTVICALDPQVMNVIHAKLDFSCTVPLAPLLVPLELTEMYPLVSVHYVILDVLLARMEAHPSVLSARLATSSRIPLFAI